MANPEIVQKSVEATFEEMKKYSPEEYAKIEADPHLKEFIAEAATFAAGEEVAFDREFLQNPGEEVVSLLTGTLSVERIQLIQEALTIPTFDMTLEIIPYKNTKGNDVMLAEFKMEDEEFLPPMEIETLDGINRAKVFQYASIVIEAVMLAMQAAGIKVHVSKGTMRSAIKQAATKIKGSSVVQRALQTFVKSWRRAGSNNWAKARAVFFLLKDCQAGGLFWTIVKSLCKEMSWWDWAKTSAQVTAMIIAAFASGGAALIAKIFLALLSAARLVRKISNVIMLEEFEQNLYESKAE
ncbi:uncharacterized protein [Montipora capricornis]|uniref:uncharacterized protein n=1 Tax=Montipora capricornis TaxID=246305 RepID=UPI0035F1C1F5